MASVALDAVRKQFPRESGNLYPALHSISLEIPEGELLAIVGPSGAGKSTLLRLVAGLESPDSGCIRIGGRDVTQVPAQDRDVAMVFQRDALFPHLTVAENIGFGLRVRGTPAAERSWRVRQIAERLGLQDRLDAFPAALSGGERQRVALGRALARNAGVYLLDEPLASLDPHRRWDMRAEIARLHRELRATILFVTHDQAEAAALGTRVAVLQAGRLLQVAPPAELYQAPATIDVAQFFGFPPINQLHGEVIAAQGPPRFRYVPEMPGAKGPVDSSLLRRTPHPVPGPAILAIRPEHLLRNDAPPESWFQCAASFERWEYLLPHRYAVLKLGSATLCCLADDWPGLPSGTIVRLAARPETLLFFTAPPLDLS